MTADLFSQGFAWSDDVATAATPVATPRQDGSASQNVRNSDVLSGAVAGVAGVAETEGQRLERLLSQPLSPIPVTRPATAETAVSCGLQADCHSAVTDVASVANWAAGVERMQRAPGAPSFYHGNWRQLVQDARSFMSMWARDAIKAGWDTLDVFGGNPDPQHGRYDRLGLLILIAGRPIQALDSDIAYIGEGTAATTYRRALRAPGGVPVWQWIREVRQ